MNNIQKTVISARTSDDKWNLWESALKDTDKTLEETLIQENADYLKWSREEVLSCWGEKGTEKIKQKWEKESPKTKEDIINYYNTLDLYIPELSSWHAMVKNIDHLKNVEFLQLCLKSNCSSFLDYGAGIGSSGLVFYYYGFSVTLADISDVMLNYSKWRFQRHNAKARFIDLKKMSIGENLYDCITAIEVLEHVSNPVDAMRKIYKALKSGGYVFVTTPFFKDEKRPQHLVHDMNTAKEFEHLGFSLIKENGEGLYRLYKK